MLASFLTYSFMSLDFVAVIVSFISNMITSLNPITHPTFDILGALYVSFNAAF